MSTNRRSLDVRVAEKQRLLEAEMKKLKAYEAQLKALNAKKRDEDRKARAHRLIEVGAAVESILGEPITKEMLPQLLDFLERQERNGKYFSKAMGVNRTEEVQHESEQDDGAGDSFGENTTAAYNEYVKFYPES